MNKLEQRYSFEYNGRKIYDFEQTLDEMKIFVRPPPVISSGKQVKCVIEATHLKLGLVSSSDGSNSSSTPQSWYLDEDTYDLVDVDESTWTLEDDDYYSDDSKVIAIYLIKARRGTLWESALKGNPNAVKAAGAPTMPMAKMDPIQKEQMKQSLLLQRFQEENPYVLLTLSLPTVFGVLCWPLSAAQCVLMHCTAFFLMIHSCSPLLVFFGNALIMVNVCLC